MILRQRVEAREYPYNVAYEVLMERHEEDTFDKLPEDFLGSMYYVIYTKLRERERKIIEMYWRDRLTLAQIADVLNLSKERVSELNRKALRRMRHPSAAKFIIKGVSGVLEEEKRQGEHNAKAVAEFHKGCVTDPDAIDLFELEFHVRIYNALRRKNINTLGDLIREMEETRCSHIRNLGKGSVINILKKFEELGIKINNMPEVFDEWNITLQDLRG